MIIVINGMTTPKNAFHIIDRERRGVPRKLTEYLFTNLFCSVKVEHGYTIPNWYQPL